MQKQQHAVHLLFFNCEGGNLQNRYPCTFPLWFMKGQSLDTSIAALSNSGYERGNLQIFMHFLILV